MRRIGLIGLLLLVLLLALPPSASAQTSMFEDTFDSELVGLNITALTNWIVTGNLDVIGSGPPSFFDLYSGNGNYLDMDGSCGNASIESKMMFNLSPGTYELSFELGNNPYGGGVNGLMVQLGSAYSESFSTPAGSPPLTLVTRQITVAAPTVARITFAETGLPSCGGSILDDVRLVLLSTSVQIDIKPGSFPNSINVGSGGTIPVAILSTPTFDATTVDPSTVTLESAAVHMKGNGSPQSAAEDVNGDGLPDLVVHISTEALQLSETDTQAMLTGQTYDGVPIIGYDSVRVVP